MNTGMRRIVTLVDWSSAGRANVQAACRLAADRGAAVLAVFPIQVPDVLPLDYPMSETVSDAAREGDRAKMVGQEFGVILDPIICQAYSVVDAVVGVALEEAADAIALAAPRGLPRWLRWLHGPGPGIVRRSPCPVLLVDAGWRPRLLNDIDRVVLAELRTER